MKPEAKTALEAKKEAEAQAAALQQARTDTQLLEKALEKAEVEKKSSRGSKHTITSSIKCKSSRSK
jgi:hypothetical protein